MPACRPEFLLLGVGAGVVAAGDEGGFGVGNALQRLGRALAAHHAGRIVGRADDDEVVVHDVLAAHAVAGVHERVFAGAGMDQQHVGVAVLAQLERLARAHGDHLDRGAGLRLEVGQDVGQQTRVLGAGGGGQDQVLDRRSLLSSAALRPAGWSG